MSCLVVKVRRRQWRSTLVPVKWYSIPILMLMAIIFGTLTPCDQAFQPLPASNNRGTVVGAFDPISSYVILLGSKTNDDQNDLCSGDGGDDKIGRAHV